MLNTQPNRFAVEKQLVRKLDTELLQTMKSKLSTASYDTALNFLKFMQLPAGWDSFSVIPKARTNGKTAKTVVEASKSPLKNDAAAVGSPLNPAVANDMTTEVSSVGEVKPKGVILRNIDFFICVVQFLCNDIKIA